MTYRVVQQLGDTEVTDPSGRVWMTPSLVEDDDNVRLLLLGGGWVPARDWVVAHSSGAVAVIVPTPSGWVSMTAEKFIEHRVEHHETGTYRIEDNSLWSLHTTEPQYRTMAATMVVQSRVVTEFVQLHAHSEHSSFDGLSKVSEMVAEAVKDGEPALGVTDHGTCAGHPPLQEECDKAGIKPIFGIETYLVDDRFSRAPSKPKLDPKTPKDEAERILAEWDRQAKAARDYYHLILWAETQEGLRNLWALSTQAHREGSYYHPRIDWEVLETHASGLLVSTACLRGPINHPLIRFGDTEKAHQNLARLLHIFGPDNTFMELHTTSLPEQIEANKYLVGMAHEQGLPMVAVTDSHYPCVGDKYTHRVWLRAQTDNDVKEDGDLFAGDQDYHLMPAREVVQRLSYLGESVAIEAVRNTALVAERCKAEIKPFGRKPVYNKKAATREDNVALDRELAIRICIENWWKTEGKTHPFDVYADRLEHEARVLTEREFWGYFLMNWDETSYAKRNRILVGPGRGSGGGCLIAYLMGIVDIDPVEADLMFERFISPGRDKMPDFDIDFPSSKRDVLTNYEIERWGEAHVVRVGTHIRLKNKGAIAKAAGILGEQYGLHPNHPDLKAISAIITEAEADTAGKGLPWEQLWEQHGEVLQPYRDKYELVFDFAEKIVGRISAYGKHAAGLVISPDVPLTGSLPLRLAGEEGKKQLVAEYAMEALESLGLIKFDLLTLRTLDTIQECIDLIETRRGDVIDPSRWKEEYDDPQVWEEISAGRTLGIFQIETAGGTGLCKRFKPRSIADLSDVITIVRPGPKRSGLTETYLRRRAGQEEVTFPDPRLEQVLAKTLGCILYQEDVMRTCMVLAGYTSAEADEVRVILGKKKTELVAKEGERFIAACVERGMERSVVEALWNQLGEFAKYSFNRAHAWGYAVLGFWCAWLKFHYPHEFLAAILSTVEKERISEFIHEARRLGYKVLPPDVNESGMGFKMGANLSIRYGFNSVMGIGEGAANAIIEGQPYTSWDDFLARKGAKCNMGHIAILAAVGTFDSIYPNRKALESLLEWEKTGASVRCTYKDENRLGPNGLPCTFDWSSEPVVMGKRGPLKQKPIPKKCTKACRNYTAPTINLDEIVPYNDEQIRQRELELLGAFLTSTPFDRIPPEVLESDFAKAEDVIEGAEGEYVIAATVARIKPHRDRNNKEMAFVDLFAQTGVVGVTLFKDDWKKYRDQLTPHRLVVAAIKKNSRGHSLMELVPL